MLRIDLMVDCYSKTLLTKKMILEVEVGGAGRWYRRPGLTILAGWKKGRWELGIMGSLKRRVL